MPPKTYLRGFLCAIPVIHTGRRADVRPTSCGRSPTCLPCAASRRTTAPVIAARTAARTAAAPALRCATPAPATRARAPATPAPALPVPAARAASPAPAPRAAPAIPARMQFGRKRRYGQLLCPSVRDRPHLCERLQRLLDGFLSHFRGLISPPAITSFVRKNEYSGGAPSGAPPPYYTAFSYFLTSVSVTLSPLMSTSLVKPSGQPSHTFSARTSLAKAAEQSASFARPSAS